MMGGDTDCNCRVAVQHTLAGSAVPRRRRHPKLLPPSPEGSRLQVDSLSSPQGVGSLPEGSHGPDSGRAGSAGRRDLDLGRRRERRRAKSRFYWPNLGLILAGSLRGPQSRLSSGANNGG